VLTSLETIENPFFCKATCKCATSTPMFPYFILLIKVWHHSIDEFAKSPASCAWSWAIWLCSCAIAACRSASVMALALENKNSALKINIENKIIFFFILN